MALDPFITAEDHAKLPDHLKGEYKLNDKDPQKRLFLDVKPNGGWALEDVAGLKHVLSERTERQKAAAEKLAAFGDLTPEAAKEAIEKLAALGDAGDVKKLDERIKSITKQAEDKYRNELAAKDAKLGGLTQTLSRALIEGEAARVLADSAVKGSFPLLIGVIKQWAKIEVDDKGGFALKIVNPETQTPLLSQKQGNNGPMGLEEFVLSLRNNPDYKLAFAGTGSTGSGATGSTPATNPPANNAGLSATERLKRFRSSRQ